MQVIKSLLALAFVLVGLAFGVLNRQPIRVDIWFRFFEMRLGLLLLTVLLFGTFLGGAAVMAGVVWPLRRRLNRKGDSSSGPDSDELSQTRNS
jgi:uncharacterized membrane protein YciS (DUF1049 family)